MAMPAAYPTIGLIRELARLEPFGNGNSKPQFADRELALLRASVVGRNQNVLKLSLMTAAGEHVSAVYFGDVEAWKQYYSEKYGQTEVDAALRGRASHPDVGDLLSGNQCISGNGECPAHHSQL